MDGKSFLWSSYDVGVNDDRYSTWRNTGRVGYVQLAFKVITEAIYDLIGGDRDDMMSANLFFFGEMSKDNKTGDSLYPIWSRILGIEDGQLPDIVLKHRDGHVPQDDIEFIRNLCTTMKTI